MIFDPLELNYSKVQAYLNCPLLYRFIYVDRRFAPQTAFSSLGLSVHRALARYHGGGRDLSDLIRHYEDAWLHHGYTSAQQSMEFYAKGAETLEKWWAYNQEHKAEIIYWERQFEFEFERWKIKGTIDRVDRLPGGEVEVIDYKMGFEGKTAADVSSSLQLSIYAIAMSRAFRQKVGALSYLVLTGPQKVSVQYDPSTEEKTLKVLRETGEKILDMDMNGRGDCARCPIRKTCPESKAKEDPKEN